jgi:hypothetical protein
MGIRHLYSHLSPYARPETFRPSDTNTALFIDGPALCHHIYHLLFCAAPSSGNAFETAVPYRTLALAFSSYLSRLESSGFKMYLPPAVPPTR